MSQIIRCKNNLDETVEISRDKFFFRPSAYGIAVKSGHVLVLKNRKTGKLWFPGGGVELGESIFDAIRREYLEETGLRIRSIGKLLLFKENFFYFQPTNEAMHAYLFFYFCEIEEGGIGIDGQKEFEDIERCYWHPLEDIGGNYFNSDISEDIIIMLRNINQI